jgi:hypothetical protein
LRLGIICDALVHISFFHARSNCIGGRVLRIAALSPWNAMFLRMCSFPFLREGLKSSASGSVSCCNRLRRQDR